jgi:hypothetical protein
VVAEHQGFLEGAARILDEQVSQFGDRADSILRQHIDSRCWEETIVEFEKAYAGRLRGTFATPRVWCRVQLV